MNLKKIWSSVEISIAKEFQERMRIIGESTEFQANPLVVAEAILVQLTDELKYARLRNQQTQ